MVAEPEQNIVPVAKAIGLALDCIALFGFSILAFGSFSKTRRRRPWAKRLLFLTGLIGFALYLANFMRDMNWIHTGDDNVFSVTFNVADGWLGGWLTAMLFAGQLFGRGRRHDPPAKPQAKDS